MNIDTSLFLKNSEALLDYVSYKTNAISNYPIKLKIIILVFTSIFLLTYFLPLLRKIVLFTKIKKMTNVNEYRRLS